MSTKERVGCGPLVLASTSPRRQAILRQIRIDFELTVPDYDEKFFPGFSPRELISSHAFGKANSVRQSKSDRTILGIDTGVVIGETLFGKPKDADHAVSILSQLSGKTHTVVSGLCLLNGDTELVKLVETDVIFRRLSLGQIERYVAAGEWKGLAGGYAIQGLGALLVERIKGDYLNVVGLPAGLLADVLKEHRPDLLAIGI